MKNPTKVLPLLILTLKSHPNVLINYSNEIKGYSEYYTNIDHQAILKFFEENKDIPDVFEITNAIIRAKTEELSNAAVLE